MVSKHTVNTHLHNESHYNMYIFLFYVSCCVLDGGRAPSEAGWGGSAGAARAPPTAYIRPGSIRTLPGQLRIISI